jgi:glutaredoxin 3
MAKIEVFTSPHCSYCESAKQLLKAAALEYTERDIAVAPDNMAELQRRLPRTRALPQIFVDGAHIGGYEDLVLLRSDGRLSELADSPSAKR